MDRLYDRYQAYSWHQSHDQATILLLVPYDTVDEDVFVIIERHHIVAGVRGQPPIIKGRLYGNVDTANSMWLLEPRGSRLSTRERTTSTTSTASTRSSYAIVSDPDISSSFAASLEGGLVSDTDEQYPASPALSSPISLSLDERSGISIPSSSRRSHHVAVSHPATPPSNAQLSFASSYSSLESLHSGSSRLLTLHIEKAESMIWPSLIVGPVPDRISPPMVSGYPWVASSTPSVECKYNMDATSLLMIGLDLYDIRNSRDEAFEYFVRAWHQEHVPSSTMRLATHYLPVDVVIPSSPPSSPPSPTTSLLLSTPTSSSFLPISPIPLEQPIPPMGTSAYHLHVLGGSSGLAQLYLEAGLLHLEGAASSLLSSTHSYAGLSALRSVPPTTHGGTEEWRRDRDAARRYFDRATVLCPSLEVPLLPPDPEPGPPVFKMPVMDVTSDDAEEQEWEPGKKEYDARQKENAAERKRRREETRAKMQMGGGDDDDNTWYLYLPGLVGAGTALLVVGILSFSSWRRGQNS